MTNMHEEIVAAEKVIRPYIRRTPVAELRQGVTVKLECLQHAGAFKTRGAFANLLLRDVPPAGVVAASGGNHGVAVSYAAMRLGIPARIYVPTVCSPAKVERIRGYGADLVITGDFYGDALAASEEWRATSGAMPVHAFDQHETLLGTGTIGLELSAQVDDFDTVLCAVGGGGLIGGLASWFAGAKKVVGVEPEGAPTLTRALAEGRPVPAPAGSIAADSLAPYKVGELMFPIAQKHVSEVLLVTDDEIRRAQETLWQELRVVAEPGGATAFAALLSGRYRPAAGERIAIVVSGANTTAVDFNR